MRGGYVRYDTIESTNCIKCYVKNRSTPRCGLLLPPRSHRVCVIEINKSLSQCFHCMQYAWVVSGLRLLMGERLDLSVLEISLNMRTVCTGPYPVEESSLFPGATTISKINVPCKVFCHQPHRHLRRLPRRHRFLIPYVLPRHSLQRRQFDVDINIFIRVFNEY